MQLLDDQRICETLLYLYLSDMKESCLSDKLISGIDSFMEFCRLEDKLNNTQNIAFIKAIYENELYNDRPHMLKSMAMSETALYRFRHRTFERLNKHLSEVLQGGEDSPETTTKDA